MVNKGFKDDFSNICVSKELERKILDMTINKEKKSKGASKLVYISLGAIMIGALSLTLGYAEEIKQFFQNWSSSVVFENGEKETITVNSTFKKIPSTAKKTKEYDNSIEMSENEIEDMLNFKILGYDNATTKTMYYSTGLNENGTIGRIDIWYPRFIYENENKTISILISMLNEYADYGYIAAFKEGLDATGGKELVDSYTSPNLGVQVIIYSNDWSSERLTATFCYDNVLYSMIGDNVTEKEFKDIIEKLHL